MNRPMLPLTGLSPDVTDPVLAHVVRFARDVAWRHRSLVADPSRFGTALQGYYRAWRTSEAGEIPPLDARVLRIAINAYRDAHRALHESRRSNERPAA
jgi:hypothetical protein